MLHKWKRHPAHTAGAVFAFACHFHLVIDAGADYSTLHAEHFERIRPMFVIEKGIKVPSRHTSAATAATFPVDEMEIGDSFFVSAEVLSPNTVRNAIPRINRQYATHAGTKQVMRTDRKTGEKHIIELDVNSYAKRFSCRSCKSLLGEDVGVRIWRVE